MRGLPVRSPAGIRKDGNPGSAAKSHDYDKPEQPYSIRSIRFGQTDDITLIDLSFLMLALGMELDDCPTYCFVRVWAYSKT